MLGNLIGGFIVILIGVTLAPTVADQIELARDPDPTQTEIAFRDTEDEGEENVLQEKEVLRRIANDIAEIKNVLVK
jgi:hypothetical protein